MEIIPLYVSIQIDDDGKRIARIAMKIDGKVEHVAIPPDWLSIGCDMRAGSFSGAISYASKNEEQP